MTRISPARKRSLDIVNLDDDFAAALDETDRLRVQLEHVIATNRDLAALLLSSDTRSGELLKLLITVRTLIESRDAASALDGVRGILVNVVGTQDFLIYSLDPADEVLRPIGGEGDAFEIATPVTLHGSWLGDVVRRGEVLITRGRRRESVAAVVPLKVMDRVLGAIVIASILPHREALDFCDREVLSLLGAYAATAIIAADRRRDWQQLPLVLS